MLSILHRISGVIYKAFGLTYSEITWEKYMGNWHEAGMGELPPGNDPKLYSMPTHKLPHRPKFGKPSLEELTSLLNYHCAELEIIRGKTVIGYYANSDTWLRGYNKIHSEDVEHMSEEIVNKIPDNIKELDFILSFSLLKLSYMNFD